MVNVMQVLFVYRENNAIVIGVATASHVAIRAWMSSRL